MTTIDRFDRFDRADRDIAGAMAELALPTIPDYVDEVLAVTARTSQRPAWTFAQRWLPMSALTQRLPVLATGLLRPVVTLILVALLLAAILVAVAGAPRPLPDPFGLAANGNVAYAAGGDLVLYDPASGASRPLVGGADTDAAPMWSPDGTRLLFLRGVAPTQVVAVATADGRSVDELTESPLFGPEPAWSPDGRSIAVSHESDDQGLISIFRLDGGGRTDLVDLGVSASSPAWRPPDGREILFRGVDATGVPNLYLVNADGSGVRSLDLASTALDGGETALLGASWSPDGTKIMYGGLEFKTPDGVDRYRTHIVDADGTNDRMIEAPGDTSDVWPVWSPDGRFIHFERVQGEYLGDGAEVWLVIAAADGASIVEVSAITDPEGLSAVWSPDGTRLLAHYATLNEVYEIDPKTGAATKQDLLTNGPLSWQRVAP